jgi:hypothetical protein
VSKRPADCTCTFSRLAVRSTQPYPYNPPWKAHPTHGGLLHCGHFWRSEYLRRAIETECRRSWYVRLVYVVIGGSWQIAQMEAQARNCGTDSPRNQNTHANSRGVEKLDGDQGKTQVRVAERMGEGGMDRVGARTTRAVGLMETLDPPRALCRCVAKTVRPPRRHGGLGWRAGRKECTAVLA